MDTRLRELERAVVFGDSRAKRSFARELMRVGRERDARPLYGDLLAESPADEVLRQEYIASGGFWAESYNDREGLGDSILYRNLELNDELVDVIVGNDFLAKGDFRTFDQWKMYVQRNKKGMTLPTARLEGAVARELFVRRDHPAFEDVVKQYVAVFRAREESWPVYGKLTYSGGTQAALEEMSFDKTSVIRSVDVPFFDGNYCSLAEEKRDSALGVTSIPGEAHPLLAELFGKHYEESVKAFQFFTGRRDRNLSEVRLWTPSSDGRRNYFERALVLGRDIFYYRFIIGCIVIGVRPVVGCRAGAKIST